MRHLRVLQAISFTTVTLLLSFMLSYVPDTASGADSLIVASPSVDKSEPDPCAGRGDVFLLDVPGTYSTFAFDGSDSVLAEVRGNHGELLANNHEVFTVESSSIIHVLQQDDSPYELFVVRLDGAGAFSDMHVRPPVEHIINESGSCLIGDLRETFKIHTEAVYSDANTRQVFVVDSPNRQGDS